MVEYRQPVIFKLGNEEYGVDINLVNGIEQRQQIIPVPNTKSYIIGIMNLRGEVIPVYSLRKKFNMEWKAGQQENMIITRVQDTKVALAVDSVSEIHGITENNISELPGIVRTREIAYFNGVAHLGNRLILLIDMEKLMTEEEIQDIEHIKEQMGK